MTAEASDRPLPAPSAPAVTQGPVPLEELPSWFSSTVSQREAAVHRAVAALRVAEDEYRATVLSLGLPAATVEKYLGYVLPVPDPYTCPYTVIPEGLSSDVQAQSAHYDWMMGIGLAYSALHGAKRVTASLEYAQGPLCPSPEVIRDVAVNLLVDAEATSKGRRKLRVVLSEGAYAVSQARLRPAGTLLAVLDEVPVDPVVQDTSRFTYDLTAEPDTVVVLNGANRVVAASFLVPPGLTPVQGDMYSSLRFDGTPAATAAALALVVC